MLKVIMGTAGTGKTTRLLEGLTMAVKDGEKAILLVPEQSSFEAERMLEKKLGPQMALNVEVFSFTRLCNAVFRSFGGLAGVAISEAGKYMVMSVALTELKDTLSIYKKSASNTAFLQTMVEACADFKTAGVTPDKMEELAGECAGTPLGDKLEELAVIYGAYQGLLGRGYVDPDDDLIRACKLLAEHDFFGGYCVYVDGFTTFMAAEFELLRHIISQAKDITVAMTADQPDNQRDTGVFAPVLEAQKRLRRYAKSAGVPVAPTDVLHTPHRYKNEVLAHISRNFLQPDGDTYEGDIGDGLRFYEAGDLYREIEYVAAQIALLVREHGYRYRDIAVVARDPEPYARAVSSLFLRYNIPYFADEREEVENLPLANGVLMALDAVRSNYDPEAVLALAKSPLLGLDVEKVAFLENYCYCWGVRGAVWTMPFANNPRGLAENLSQEDMEALVQLNETRELLMSPLMHLREGVRGTTGKRFAKAVYDFLQEVNAANNLEAYARQMNQGERESFLDQSAQLWDMLMEVLDVFGAVLGGVSLQQSRACELFRIAVNTLEIGQVPQMLDQVLVGAADRIRPGEVRAVFVIGANEGIFPPQVSSSGIFTEAERQEMARHKIEIARSALGQAVLEKFFAYFAVTLPAERLYVSWLRGDLQGREMQPSAIVLQLEAITKGNLRDELNDCAVIAGEKSAFQLLAKYFREDNGVTAALETYFAATEKESTLRKMQAAVVRKPHGVCNKELAGQLFGRALRLSPSRVERYYRCPFSYFAADGLSLKKRRRVEFNPLESGSVIHNVLQVMVQRHGGKGLATLAEEELAAQVREIITEYLESRVEDAKALPVRFQYLFSRLTGTLARLLAHMGREFSQSEFEPVACELPISTKDGVEPLRLVSPAGIPVTVEGIVDRVDVMEKNGRKYVRVVDYKSGGKDFKVHDILYGLNMQMLLYLFTIQENGKGALEGAVPAGVLYMPVRESYTSSTRDQKDKEGEREKQWRMNGLLLEDEEVLQGMEKDVAGVFIPAKRNKKGELDAKSSLANLAQMGRLAEKVREMVTSMAGALAGGQVAAEPVCGGDFDTCAYCDYRSVCGFEPGDAVKTIEKVEREEFFKLLEGEQNG